MSTQETGSNGPTTQTLEEPPTETDADAEVEAAEETSATSLSLDLIFEILKNERRREVIRYLREHEEQVTLSDLAEHIAALENDTDIASITSSQRKRVYVGLYQCHLPKMADMGIVEFNQNRGIVALGENAPQLYQYLDNDTPCNREWHRYYLGIAGAGVVAFAASAALSTQFALAPLLALAGLCLAVAACAAVQTYEQRADDD